MEPERAEEQRPEPVQHRPGPGGERPQVGLVRAREPLGIRNAGGEPLPADGGGDGAVQVLAGLLGLDQRGAELGEQTHLVVDCPRVAQHGAILLHLRAAEHAAHGAVEQGDALVGQARGRVQHGGDQGRASTKWGQRPQVLGGVAAALARELAQALGMHALGAGGIEADRAQASELLHQAPQRLVAWGACGLPRPGQHAHRRALVGGEQRVQRGSLVVGQAASELGRDVALGQHGRARDQLLDDKRPGGDDPPAA